MQLDQARITIRERSFLEILDLALRIIQGHPVAILVLWLIGTFPFFVFNDIVFNQAILADLPEDLQYSDEEELGEVFSGYAFAQIAIFVEAPLATSLITLFLGQVLFVKSPSLQSVASGFGRCFGQLFLFLGILRFFAAICCFFPLLFVYWLMPFTNEVIVLERASVSRTWNRLGSIRKDFLDTLFVRGLMSGCFGLLCIVSVWSSLTVLQNLMVDQHWVDASVVSLRWLVPISIWVVVGYFSVVRFLSYLDLRIRKEGWDVELQMRAEGQRLQEKAIL